MSWAKEAGRVLGWARNFVCIYVSFVGQHGRLGDERLGLAAHFRGEALAGRLWRNRILRIEVQQAVVAQVGRYANVVVVRTLGRWWRWKNLTTLLGGRVAVLVVSVEQIQLAFLDLSVDAVLVRCANLVRFVARHRGRDGVVIAVRSDGGLLEERLQIDAAGDGVCANAGAGVFL